MLLLLLQNAVAGQEAREQAAKANFGQHEAMEQAKKQEEKKELAQKDASKERAVKHRAAKMHGCFIIRECCPTVRFTLDLILRAQLI